MNTSTGDERATEQLAEVQVSTPRVASAGRDPDETESELTLSVSFSFRAPNAVPPAGHRPPSGADIAMNAPPATPRSLGFSIKNLVLKEYDPEKDGLCETWIRSVRRVIRADEVMMGARWPDEPLYLLVSSKLMGSASTWAESYEKATPAVDRTLENFFKALREHYGTKFDEVEAVERLATRPKRVGETYTEYATALRSHVEGVDIPEFNFVSAFLKGLSSTTGPLIRAQTPANLNAAVYAAYIEYETRRDQRG
ncbi:hypothetical protein P43SY_009158 [Pythium insidiosum]|uniref:Ty3 transposon capsid-like protein domain-containing protein n=1 Tax=Pythium insidiosum TaxID=114742 RepID=A0AAD5QE76_PYTIN|nr:hypothetical protein P43SY_009158 [Pythium insidiosum]